ncbi:MAG: hypothetical protein FXV79_01660 [Candidatus Thioglobus sp.]|nr:MAG: hypothetical protein FXV80_00165 [Candidatus Thioglobus sp.]KAA0454066.1 MAG: hypothetical protein FXV79_01660 [Candidatus Thioglobus sp.]
MTTLIVDLDHTLIDTDLLYESSIGALKSKPWLLFMLPFWFGRGKGYLKHKLVQHFQIDAAKLPYNKTTINYIKTRKKQGDKAILATASHEFYALAVEKHLALFDDVMASNKDFNLSGGNKAGKLVERFGVKGFDYIGDHKRDIPVWEAANLAILVNASKSLIKKTQHFNRLILSKKN